MVIHPGGWQRRQAQWCGENGVCAEERAQQHPQQRTLCTCGVAPLGRAPQLRAAAVGRLVNICAHAGWRQISVRRSGERREVGLEDLAVGVGEIQPERHVLRASRGRQTKQDFVE